MVKLTSLTAFLFASVTYAKNVDVSEYGGVERMLQVNTEVPSAAPTIACSESDDDEFQVKTKWGLKTGTCGWLQDRGDKMKKQICKQGQSGGELGPAKEVCKKTCGTCGGPKPSPAPITKPPTSCIEDEDDEFYVGFNRRNKEVVTQTCGWLEGLKNERMIKRHCRKKRGKRGIPVASKVCVETCGICKSPTASPAPTPTPKQCDAENEEDEFMLRKGRKGKPIPGTCGWLDDLETNTIAKICKTSKPFGDYDAARNVCVKTCKNCIE